MCLHHHLRKDDPQTGLTGGVLVWLRFAGLCILCLSFVSVCALCCTLPLVTLTYTSMTQQQRLPGQWALRRLVYRIVFLIADIDPLAKWTFIFRRFKFCIVDPFK